jgi:hypothetical protein
VPASCVEVEGKVASERGEIKGWRCPFCEADQLLLSTTDLPIDTERLEVYCDNSNCEAIVILIERGGGAHRRADVGALRAVDRGTDAEQEAMV